MTTPSFAQHLTAWKESVAGQKHPPLPLEIVATTLDEFRNWQAQLQATKIEAGKHGYACQFNKGGTKSGRVAAWITSGGFTLKIAFTAKKETKHTNVTETSRNSYHSQDFTTQEDKIAKAIFDHSILGGDITRAEIANWTGIQEGRVSARVFSLLKQYRDGGYTDKSGNYRLVLTAPRLSVFIGASKVPNEAMRFDKCEPSPVGEQTEMRF
jgi:hypothetical protein